MSPGDIFKIAAKPDVDYVGRVEAWNGWRLEKGVEVVCSGANLRMIGWTH
jgi:hypothetical protein